MELFKKQGNWYKGNIHAHTTESDGWLSPKNLAKSFCENGYNFLAITDHWKLTKIEYKTDEQFILLPGTELNGALHDVGDFHFVGLGITKPIESKVKSVDSYMPQDIIDLITDAGGMAFLAHPSWNGVSWNEIMPLKNLLGLEVYNSGCDYEIARGYGDVQYTEVIDRNKKLFCFAVDDCHRVYNDAFRGWINVKAKTLTQQTILKAIKEGMFYSSTGPDILNVERNGNKVYVKCSAARRINLISNPRLGSAKITREGEIVTETELPLSSQMSYFRIEVYDLAGRKAWTNPFYL